jgi:large subunit ribosomal protein L21e
MKRSQGYRSKTRALLTKPAREKGKIKIRKLLYNYQPGDKVVIKIDPSIHKGMPHRRYHGKIGVITNKRGRAYIINVTQGNATKEVIVRPEHLEPYTGIKNG